MTYYKLVSPYEGDVTKNCGLSIEEVDQNFFSLEDKLYSLVNELSNKFDEIHNSFEAVDERLKALEDKKGVLSMTMHDAQICPPGTSNNADYNLIDNYIMIVSGKIGYSRDILPDGQLKGNRFGVAIMPLFCKQRLMYPNATWKIFDDEMGNLWDEIGTNPAGWETALYLYPKVERIDGKIKVSLAGISDNSNEMVITINWDDDNSETFTYIVDEDVELETILSKTVHDTVICPPGTSNEAIYSVDPDDRYTMNIGGTVYYNNEKIPGTETEKGYRVGVAIQPYPETTEEKYPNAVWYINETEMGSLWEEINSNPETWEKALYLYPKIEKIYQGLVVSLAGVSNCTNDLRIRIDWSDGISETYTYIVDKEINLIKQI